MIDDEPSSFAGSIRSERELQETIRAVLRAASESGVDPQGSWDIKNGPDHPDWEVMVLELAKGTGD